MTIGALAGVPEQAGASSDAATGTDRIDVTDEHGVRIGWVDPRTGARNLLAPERAADFEDMVDFWLAAAGLSDDTVTSAPTAAALPDGTNSMRVREVRYPDPEVVRSLVIPLLPLRGN